MCEDLQGTMRRLHLLILTDRPCFALSPFTFFMSPKRRSLHYHISLGSCVCLGKSLMDYTCLHTEECVRVKGIPEDAGQAESFSRTLLINFCTCLRKRGGGNWTILHERFEHFMYLLSLTFTRTLKQEFFHI